MAHLPLSLERSLSYRNQSKNSHCKLEVWFLFGRDLHHERVTGFLKESSDDYNVNIAITQSKGKVKQIIQCTCVTVHVMILTFLNIYQIIPFNHTSTVWHYSSIKSVINTSWHSFLGFLYCGYSRHSHIPEKYSLFASIKAL